MKKYYTISLAPMSVGISREEALMLVETILVNCRPERKGAAVDLRSLRRRRGR